MDSVAHFEIPCDDRERAGKFYSKAFGWSINDMPEMKYTMAQTGAVDENFIPTGKGYVGGGLFNKGDMDLKTTMITMSVKNIEESLEKIVEAGGEIIKERITIGDMGAIAYFKDTEGNINGIWEDAKKA